MDLYIVKQRVSSDADFTAACKINAGDAARERDWAGVQKAHRRINIAMDLQPA